MKGPRIVDGERTIRINADFLLKGYVRVRGKGNDDLSCGTTLCLWVEKPTEIQVSVASVWSEHLEITIYE